MEVVHPGFRPDPALSREEMEQLQREIAETATFEDDLAVDPATICCDGDQRRLDAALEASDDGGEGAAVDANDNDADESGTPDDGPPLVAGVDQAFVDGQAVSAVVVSRGEEVIERASAVVDTEIPYVPGLLSFREGEAILAAFEALDADPDLTLVDGSGRIHYREAGLATHVGVALETPAVGVAKSLLCGRPRESLDRKLPTGARVGIEADGDVETAADGTLIGYAVQTRQFESGDRYVNPLYVSPGHRVSAESAADAVQSCCSGYKLPEPTRRADADADELASALRDGDGADT